MEKSRRAFGSGASVQTARGWVSPLTVGADDGVRTHLSEIHAKYFLVTPKVKWRQASKQKLCL